MENTMNLQAFMRESVIEREPVKYVASKRIKDAAGNPIEWLLQPIKNETMDKLAKKYTKKVQVKGTREYVTETDTKALQNAMAVESIIYPNLNDEALQNSWEAIGAEDLLYKLLSPGELADLHLAVLEANDIEAGMADEVKK